MDTLLGIGLGNALGATVLAALAAVMGRLCRRPALRHGLWLLVLLKLLTPPLVPVRLPRQAAPVPAVAATPVAQPHPPEFVDVRPGGDAEDGPPQSQEMAATAAPAAPRAAAPEPLTPRLSWSAGLLPVWLAGSCLWWALAGLRLARFRRLLRFAEFAPAALQDEACRLAARIGLRRAPGVWLVPAAVSPMLWALGGAPRLLLPAALWAHLGDEQRQALLLHELAHLRRGDHRVRWLELAALGLYWWHPVAWWARRELREAEEQCCDAWVLWAVPDGGPAYATALLETVAFLSQTRSALPAAASGAGRVRPLKRRLTMILRGSPSRTLSWGGLLVVLGLAALLPLWPTWAQAPDAAARERSEEAKSLPLQSRIARAPDAPAGKSSSAGAGKVQAPSGRAGEWEGGFRKGPTEIEELEDEVELLEARLAVKQAEVEAARTAIATAQKAMQQYDTAQDRQRAQAEIVNQEAQLRVKEAELREPMVRLKQARRRLTQLQQPAAAQTQAEPSPAWARNLFESLDKDLGQLRGGAGVKYQFRFPMKNRSGETVHVAQVRMSSGTVTAEARPKELAPGADGAVVATLDSSRLAGEKVMKIVVAFDRPRPATVVLSVHFVASRQGPPHSPPKEGNEPTQADTQQRLQNLEKKLDALLREMDALRRELHPAKQGAKMPEDNSGDFMVTHTRGFRVPFQLDPATLARVRKLVLAVSADGGKTWETAATASPDQKHFDYEAPADGVYWFKLYFVDDMGQTQPPHSTKATPDLKVLVQSNK